MAARIYTMTIIQYARRQVEWSRLHENRRLYVLSFGDFNDIAMEACAWAE